MSEYSEEMALSIEGTQIDGSSIPDYESIHDYESGLKEPDYIPVKYEEKIGLTPNPKSPKFDDLNFAAEGYALFWRVTTRETRGVIPDELIPITWIEFTKDIINKILVDDVLETLRYLSNSKAFKSLSFSSEEVLDSIIDGCAKERLYDFRRWGF